MCLSYVSQVEALKQNLKLDLNFVGKIAIRLSEYSENPNHPTFYRTLDELCDEVDDDSRGNYGLQLRYTFLLIS